MYAIVDIAGQQFKVKKDQKIFVHRLEGEVGNQVDFDRVLLIDNDTNVAVGAPVITGAMVSAKILEHVKGDKVIVFKKKRRKGYRVKNGHRQYMTQIVIEEIIETGAKPKVVAEKKVVAAKVAEPKAAE
jgi:large subunit ribosomal protein L21